MDSNEKLDILKGELANNYEWSYEDKKWLLERLEKQDEQLTKLVCAIYEHVNEGTELMELAEKIDERD